MPHRTLTKLRRVVPQRRLSSAEAMCAAERQARALLRLGGITEPPVPTELISQVPVIQIEHAPTGQAAAATRWLQGRWLILINVRHPRARQRWSLAHEFKHVLDHPFAQVLYPSSQAGHELAEQVCDYFAGCLLVPRPVVRRIWAAGVRDVPLLARRFAVSRRAMYLRLLQVGLIDPTSHHFGKEI
jgi:Zn-dependent peptidase ImmA (M78 family)